MTKVFQFYHVNIIRVPGDDIKLHTREQNERLLEKQQGFLTL